ncbi:hypothetical protein SARC_00595 [Sphaeroforma arctica JP610]|uniref:Uncharacterized protein n=1 Tax=Sphaeroforma arctica JP610 TaxID=667725 RepID=A0A0L0GE14_9EUKA|nr:hypothetical protein SARC_00595 [Sphaeroforma arctica JP610]KNC87267.1 hypothetical protein SARC_00595 [Sphaeroforma arctica JP610]|eukprot:XP_014161169.1 hypothetical protein SARC_00595 [Sphaeroforma arctica JP610]
MGHKVAKVLSGPARNAKTCKRFHGLGISASVGINSVLDSWVARFSRPTTRLGSTRAWRLVACKAQSVRYESSTSLPHSDGCQRRVSGFTGLAGVVPYHQEIIINKEISSFLSLGLVP